MSVNNYVALPRREGVALAGQGEAVMRRVVRLYAAAALSRLTDAITTWRVSRGILTAEEEAFAEGVSRAAREAMRPPQPPSDMVEYLRWRDVTPPPAHVGWTFGHGHGGDA